jgi:hypothetical protein
METASGDSSIFGDVDYGLLLVFLVGISLALFLLRRRSAEDDFEESDGQRTRIRHGDL